MGQMIGCTEDAPKGGKGRAGLRQKAPLGVVHRREKKRHRKEHPGGKFATTAAREGDENHRGGMENYEGARVQKSHGRIGGRKSSVKGHRVALGPLWISRAKNVRHQPSENRNFNTFARDQFFHIRWWQNGGTRRGDF